MKFLSALHLHELITIDSSPSSTQLPIIQLSGLSFS